MRYSNRYRLLAGVALTVATIGSAAAAAPPPASDAAASVQPNGADKQAGSARANDSGDIIVTARRISERVQDVPISITVFNQQQLANRNIVNASDLATYTPSLSANTQFGSNQTSFAIRGFVQEIATAPSVGVYFADVVAPRGAANNLPIGNGAGAGSFFDLQNVQVLKGPQGTLFGRNTTGGAVLLVPQKPTSRTEGYVEGSAGNYGMKRIQAVANLPLSDIARFRIGVDHMTRDGYVRNTSPIGPKAFENVDYTAVRASLVVDLMPNLENYTIISYSSSQNNGTAEKLLACDPSSFIGAGLACPALARNAAAGNGFYTTQTTVADPRSQLKQGQIINTTTWQASDTLTVKNIVSYAQLRLYTRMPLFGVSFNTADLSPVLSGAASAALGFPITLNVPSSTINFAESRSLPNGYTANQDTFTEELQFQGHGLNDRLTWQAGGYLELSDPLSAVGSQSRVFINCTNTEALQCNDVTGPYLGGSGLGGVNYSSSRTRFRNHGLYGQADYAITDTLKLTGGIRYTWDRSSADGRLITYSFPVPNTPVPSCTLTPATPLPGGDLRPCDVRQRESSRAPTWLIGLDYKPTEDVLAYAKWSRGYRAGGVNLQAPEGFATFSPEHVDAYEAGLKTSFRGAVRGTFNVAAFYNDLRDQQLLVGLTPRNLNSSQASAIVNAGKSRIWGIEAEGRIHLFDGFDVDGSYTYLKTKIRRIQNFTTSAASAYDISPLAQQGDQLTLSPRNKLSVTGAYTLPVDRDIGTITVSATFSHSDKQISNYADREFPNVPAIYNLRLLQAQNLLNLNLNWSGIANRPIDLSVFATNVTNQKYYAFVSSLASAVGFETGTLGEPRMVGVRLRYRFGG